MTAPTHIIVALAAVSIQREVTGLQPSGFGLFLIMIGSLAPDVDGQGAIMRPARWIKSYVGESWANRFEAISLWFSRRIQNNLGHRGFLHTPLFCTLIFAYGIAWQWHWLVYFAWGYATHIAADFCTIGGIPVFGPFSYKRYKIGRIKTGSFGEILLVLFTLAILTTWSSRFILQYPSGL